MTAVALERAVLEPPDPSWAPAWYTPITGVSTDGPGVALTARNAMFASKGMRAGKALIFADWQKWALSHALMRDERDLFVFREYLLGLPRKTAKSLMGAAICIHYLVGLDKEPDERSTRAIGRELYSIAGDRQQARLVFGEGREQVLKNPVLSKRLKVYRDAIENPALGSVYRVLSHDGKLAQGLNPFLTVADEIHVYPTSQTQPGTSELYEAMRQGAGARPESLLLSITTAGDYRDDALLTRLFNYAKSIATGEAEDASFGGAWWQAPDGCDYRDEAMWHIANPNYALELADIEEMRSTVRSSPESSVRRFRLNQMVPLGGIAWMDGAAWKDAARADLGKPPANTPIVMAFDGSVSNDATALVGMTLEGHLFVIGVWENPDPDDEEWQVPRAEVDQSVADAFDLWDVKVFQCDTAYWLAEFNDWQEQYGKRRVLDFTMSNARMVPAVQDFFAGIKAGQITHEDHVVLNRHVNNAVTHETPKGITIKKQSKNSKHKIDLAVAACMANDARLRIPKKRTAARGW